MIVTVPARQEHFVNGKYYRAGESYQVPDKKESKKEIKPDVNKSTK